MHTEEFKREFTEADESFLGLAFTLKVSPPPPIWPFVHSVGSAKCKPHSSSPYLPHPPHSAFFFLYLNHRFTVRLVAMRWLRDTCPSHFTCSCSPLHYSCSPIASPVYKFKIFILFCAYPYHRLYMLIFCEFLCEENYFVAFYSFTLKLNTMATEFEFRHNVRVNMCHRWCNRINSSLLPVPFVKTA